MDRNHVCPICQKTFTQSGNLKRHINIIHSPDRQAKTPKRFSCPICNKTFTRKYDMQKHVETIHNHQQPSTHDPTYQTLVSEIIELKSKLEERDEKLILKVKEQISNELKNRPPTNITNNLNVICVTNHDNYLDMLTDRLGDFNQAIDYIKDCALSDLSGDCKLIEKIYGNSETLSFTMDHKKTTIYFHNEDNRSCSENRDSFGRKIANNLQNSYLKGINHLININLSTKKNPNQFLADYDLLTWNKHIYQLSDMLHQKKILNQLHIPLK